MEAKRIVFVGVGGQGNLLITRLLGEAALDRDIPALVSEIHGMAQRGGIVESAVVMGDVTSPIVSQGEADILIGFEPAETLRAIGKVRKTGMVLTNTALLPPFTVSVGQGSYPPLTDILQQLTVKVKRLISINAKELAKEAGSLQALNMVLLGGLIGLEQLPISPDDMKKTIKANTKKPFMEANLKGFVLGWEQTHTAVSNKC